MREVIDELDASLNDTLAFDFESIVDPTHGAPSAAVSVGAPRATVSAATPGASASFGTAPAPRPGTAVAPPEPARATELDGEKDEYDARDEDEDEEREEEEAPDLTLIPDLLVANALVARPPAKVNKPAREHPAAPTSTPATAPQSRGSHAQPVHNDTMQLAPTAGSPLLSAAPQSRASVEQPIHNDTMQLLPDAPLALQGRAPQLRASPARVTPDSAAKAPPTPTRESTSPSPAASWPQLQPLPAQSSVAQPSKAPPPPQNQAPQPPVRQPMAAQPEPTPEIAPAPAAHRQASTPQLQQASLAGAGFATAAAGGGPNIPSERTPWESLRLETVPRVSRLEPIPRRRWPVVLLALLAGVAVAVFYWLPRYAPQGLPFDLAILSRVTQSRVPSLQSASPADVATPAAASGADGSTEAKFQASRDNFDRRLAALEARGAGVWGGADFAMAKTRAAESVGAHDAGNIRIAQERLSDATLLLDQVESKAPQALADELAVGQKALSAGQEELASQAFDLARRIDPTDRRIAEGQRHTRNLNGVLPLLADGENAEVAHNYSRAAQDYSRALTLDPGNESARAGLARANAAFGEDNYAKAVGSGFAALGAGRLDDAREAFERARTLRPNGAEASEGLRRVSAALSAKGFASLRQRAAGLEAQERWDDAVQVYDSALQSDPSLAFAQEGKDRAAARAELGASMQALIDRPERLASQSVRNQARALLDTANQQSPSGPVLRSQIARLGLLLPDYDGSTRSTSAGPDLLDKPVRLSLVSDNATAIAIPSIGEFGTFAKRDIQLKPGRYTVIGTRDGYREVRRDVTIAPGQEGQTISVTCSDRI
jgi:tetratricopeptide (TPR) repeat protein